jgi:hypothetical protein
MLIDPWKRLDQSRLGIRQLEIRLRKELMLLCEDDMPPVEHPTELQWPVHHRVEVEVCVSLKGLSPVPERSAEGNRR